MFKYLLSFALISTILCGASLTLSLTKFGDEGPSPYSLPVEEENAENSDSEKDIEDDTSFCDLISIDKCYFVAYGWNLSVTSSINSRNDSPNSSRAPPAKV